jgi:hypothetical protein
MRDIGTLLTTTGVIATLFAVFFAATAMYTQYKRNNQIKKKQNGNKENHHGSSPGSLVPFDKQPHIEVSDGVHIEAADVSAVQKDKFVPPKKALNKTSSSVSSPSVFKKYMPSGIDNATIDDSSEYIWE